MGTTKIIAEPGTPKLSVTREFQAPRELLLRAFIDPELLKQWMGPRELSMEVAEYDVRHGGAYRFIHRDGDGNEFGFRGVFHGSPTVDGGVVRTFEFEGAPGHVALETATFEDMGGGRTLLRLESVHQSVEARDAHIAAGMERGVNDAMERLEELTARLAPVA